MTEPNVRVKPSSRPFWFGVIVSVVYLFGVAVYAGYRDWRLDQLSVEQFATLLSGAFAPLAFLWIVLGFRQQGDELRHSADALWLQGEELRNSVEQQKELVRAARDQIAMDQQALEEERVEQERRARPILRILPAGTTNLGDNVLQHDFSLVNLGPDLRDMIVSIDNKLHPHTYTVFGPTNSVHLPLPFEIGSKRSTKIVVQGRDTSDIKRIWMYKAIHRGADVLIMTERYGERVLQPARQAASEEGD